jgi:hypothetical protein
MDERTQTRLGAPDLTLTGFQLWVHGYEFPDSDDSWDGNWLRVTALAGGEGASIWVSGVLLDTVSVERFRRELGAMNRTLAGEAVLESHEPSIVVRVATTDRAGHLRVRVELTSNHIAQGHWFEFDADQTYLPAAIAQCDIVVERLPVRGAAAGGV